MSPNTYINVVKFTTPHIHKLKMLLATDRFFQSVVPIEIEDHMSMVELLRRRIHSWNCTSDISNLRYITESSKSITIEFHTDQFPSGIYYELDYNPDWDMSIIAYCENAEQTRFMTYAKGQITVMNVDEFKQYLNDGNSWMQF